MIKSIEIQNFKCFEDLEVEFSNLNVLTGINSMGKSTVIQSLLLLRQSYEANTLNKGIYLNGKYVNIGTGKDLLYSGGNKDEISISVSFDKIKFAKIYEYNSDSDFLKCCESDLPCTLTEMSLFNKNFSYISAERLGPKRFYPNSYKEIYEESQVGINGEYYASYLAERGLIDKIENKKVLHPRGDSEFLIFQTQEWLSDISPGIRLQTNKIIEAGIVNVLFGDSISPMNIGFGISYVAPIVLALLKAKPNDLIILENPEAHLHPSGQRKMGELIALASSGGVQVIIETHSDHILNGIRLAVKQNKIDRLKIRLNYFFVDNSDTFENTSKHLKCSPAILEDGNLSDWPEGFFDEWDKALEELF